MFWAKKSRRAHLVENQGLIVNGDKLDLARLQQLQQRPEPFTPGEPLFWDDPHISKGMLASHLNPNTEGASRRPEVIDRSVAWLVETLGLRESPASTIRGVRSPMPHSMRASTAWTSPTATRTISPWTTRDSTMLRC
jgi:hypothetical protein